MSGASRPMLCPWSHCAAMALPLTHRTDPRDTSVTAIVFPIHDVIGRSSWFGRCPASQLIIEPGLTEAGRAVLAAADVQHARMLAEREGGRKRRIAEIVHNMIDDVAGDDPMVAADGTRYKYPPGTPEGYDERRKKRHLRVVPPDESDYFPGRPADAPEPGTGEPPAEPVPANVGGGPLGKAENMSSRDTLVAMIAATRTKIGETQEAVATCLSALEALEAASTLLGPSSESAVRLGVGAVGNSNDAPDDAVNMLHMLYGAKETASGESGVPQAIGLVRVQLTHLAGQLAEASAAAERYAERP